MGVVTMEADAHRIALGALIGGLCIWLGVTVVCVLLIRRILRKVRARRRSGQSHFTSAKQPNRRMTQLVLLIYIATVFPFSALMVRIFTASQLSSLLGIIYLVSVLIGILWLGALSLADIAEIRRASRQIHDQTLHDIADELDMESDNDENEDQ